MRTILAGIIFSGLISLTGQSLDAQTPKPRVKKLASVDGMVITETHVRQEGAGDLEMLELQKLKEKAVSARNEQEILEKYLAHLIAEKLLGLEAEKRGVSKENLLNSEVDSKVKEATAEEIDAVYKDNADRIQQPKEEVADEIREAIKKHKSIYLRRVFLQKLEKEHKVDRFLEPLRFNVKIEGRPSLGPASAPVTIATFSDFQCPYCKEYNSTLKQVIKKYGDKVRLVFLQFPLTTIHRDAQKAAEASLCAARQQRFWDMHDRIFQNQSYLKVYDLKNRAKDLGLDVDSFNACLDGNRSALLVHEDLVAGFRAGADGTPSTFINGRFMNGVIPFTDLSAMIEDELARQEKPAKKKTSRR